MKKNLKNYFEIGRLDRGLFRIWLILLIPYLIFGYLIIKDEYKSYKDFNYSNESKLSSKSYYCKPNYLTYKSIDPDKEDSRIKRYGSGFHYTLKDCLLHFKNKKNDADNERKIVYSIIILLPFVVVLAFLVIKKIILWIYRGFK
mgnify:CR=1 FL=1